MPVLNSISESLFISALTETGSLTRAAQAAQLNPAHALLYYAQNPEFAKKYDEAISIACLAMESEARRRAFDGVDEAVYYKGEVVGSVRKYSDSLAMFLLKAYKPHVFGDRLSLDANLNHVAQLDEVSRVAKLAAIVEAAERKRQQQLDDMTLEADIRDTSVDGLC